MTDTNLTDRPLDRKHSGDRMTVVSAMTELSFPARAVLGFIAWRDGPGGSRPTVKSIGNHLGLGKSTIRYHIAKMIKAGVLSKRRGQRGDHYSINYSWSPDCQPPRHSENPAENAQSANPMTSRVLTPLAPNLKNLKRKSLLLRNKARLRLRLRRGLRRSHASANRRRPPVLRHNRNVCNETSR